MVCMCMMYVCTCGIGCVHAASLVSCTMSYIHMCEGVDVWWGRVWEVRAAWLCSSVTCLLACMLQSGAKASQSTVLSPVPHPLPQAPSRPGPGEGAQAAARHCAGLHGGRGFAGERGQSEHRRRPADAQQIFVNVLCLYMTFMIYPFNIAILLYLYIPSQCCGV